MMEFNSLPLEIQLKIFSYLPATSDVMKIRRVCKQWARLIDSEFKFKQFKCTNVQRSPKDPDEIEHDESDESDGSEPDETECRKFDFYLTSMRSFLDYTSNDRKFRRIKFLEARLVLKNAQLENAFDFLNSFEFLENAVFVLVTLWSWGDSSGEIQEKNFVVHLKHLRFISFNLSLGIYASKVSVLLDLPALHSIGLNSFERVTIGYPDRLKFLGIDGLLRGNQFDYTKFTSLESILTMARDVRSITPSFIERLPSLRKLDLSNVYGSLDYSLPKPVTGVKIFYYGFEIDLREINVENELPTFSSPEPSETSTRFIAQNCRRSISENPFVESARYNTMASELNDNEMLEVIPEKFPDLNDLYICETVADPEKLLKFMNKMQIDCLTLERTALPASFFQKLSGSDSPIEKLVVKTEPTMSFLEGDFDFIFQLKKLSVLEFEDSPLPLAFVAKVLKELNEITYVGFEQPETYEFELHLDDDRQEIVLDVEPFNSLIYEVKRKEAPALLNALVGRLKANGFVCPKELQALLRHLELEKETHHFMMRKYVYEQRHSIGLLPEQMSLLNLSL